MQPFVKKLTDRLSARSVENESPPLENESPPLENESPASGPRLFAWIRGLYRAVLFPGLDQPEGSAQGCRAESVEPQIGPMPFDRFGWAGRLAAWIVPALLLYPTLGFALLEPDETRYAEIPREMLARGEWVVPLLAGEPYLDKPPLLYWLTMISYSLFGVNPAAARLIPALCLHGLILATWQFGRTWLGNRAAFWGTLALSLSPGFMIMGRLLTIDALLTACVGYSLLCLWQSLRSGDRPHAGWWLAAAVCAGLGVLAKGPIALILVLPPVVIHRWLRVLPIPWFGLVLFSVVALSLGIPWYALMIARVPDFLRHFFWEHNVLRFVQPFDHQRGIWFYLPVLCLGLLPGSLLAWDWLKFQFGDRESARAVRGPTQSFVLLSGSWCVFFFTLSGCKLPTYILPAFAPLCLGVGTYLASLRTRTLAGAACLWLALLMIGNHAILPQWAAWRSPLAPGEELLAKLRDPGTPIVCYPRECHALSFALERDDLRNFRSKEFDAFRADLFTRDRTLVLCTHRHSLEGLRQLLPPELELRPVYDLSLEPPPWIPKGLRSAAVKLAGETALGLCDVAEVVRRKPPG